MTFLNHMPESFKTIPLSRSPESLKKEGAFLNRPCGKPCMENNQIFEAI